MNNETKKTVRRLDLLRGILVLTLILYIAVALIINSSYLTADRLMRLRANVIHVLTGSASDTVRIEEDDTLTVAPFQDGFAVLTRNGISVYGADGNKYSSHTLQYKNPCMEVCDKYILCFDRGSTGWVVFNSFRVLCEGTEGGNIINGRISSEGYFTIAAERSEYKGCVTVYNTKGTSLARWNSDTYLLDAFITSRNEATIVSLGTDREKTNTVFTVLNFRKGTVTITATAYDTFPLALGVKQGGQVEMLTEDGSWVFSGREVRSVHTYPETSPGIFRQGKDLTLISYQTLSGQILVEGFDTEGNVPFSLEFSSIRSLDTMEDRIYVLTEEGLYVTDRAGNLLLKADAESAAQISVSPEITLLRGANFVNIKHYELP